MKKLLVCVDGSAYADTIMKHAAWVAKRVDAEIDLLHVLRRHSDYEAPHEDHTGAIGLDARNHLMQALTKIDEERAKLDQQKGRLILEHARDALNKAGIKHVNVIHQRGKLAETIQAFEPLVDMVFIGKRGEQADPSLKRLGSNLEKVARNVHKPLFLVSSQEMQPIHKFLIAYDGKDNANKAVDFACESLLVKGLECHLLTVGDAISKAQEAVAKKLEKAGYKIVVHHQNDGRVDEVIQSYVKSQSIDLLLTGAYSHSRMRTMLLGSTTTSLIRDCHVPVILFR